jgi:hypothetical protein
MACSISDEQYEALSSLYRSLSDMFFSGTLPEVMFALESRKTCNGYFHADKFIRKDTGDKISFIALNPDYFSRPFEEVLATLLHEMCHCWVYYNSNKKDSVSAYHSKLWDQQMRNAGLEPVYMNKSRTKVGTKVMPGGKFDAWVKAVKEGDLPDIALIQSVFRDSPGNTWKSRNKTVYICPGCGAKVWGKPGMHIGCSECGKPYEEELT